MNRFESTEKLLQQIKKLLNEKEFVIIAIDGRCASGKTSLAKKIARATDCNVIHTDDFYLQDFQRTKERLSEPGGNLDRERLLSQVLEPLKSRREFSYRPFLCSSMSLGEKITVSPKPLTVIEGSYSCHPELKSNYDLTVFIDIDEETQKKRILSRNGKSGLTVFTEKWIPLEELYFSTFFPEFKR